MALKNLGQEKWKDEYAFLIEDKFLNVFNPDEKAYLNQLLDIKLFGIHTIYPSKVNIQNISKRIRKYFPIKPAESYSSIEINYPDKPT